MSTRTRYTFTVPAEIIVEVDGSDEDESTYDDAVERAQAALESFATGAGTNGVRLFADIDGVGCDKAEAIP